MRLAVVAASAFLMAACSAADPQGTTDVTATSQPPSASPTSPSPQPTSSSPAPSAEPEPEPEPTPSPALTSAAVSIADFTYAPDPVEIAVGGSVTWTNRDRVAHTASVEDGPGTEAIASGESATATFDAPGIYRYLCQFHPGSMQATVIVR